MRFIDANIFGHAFLKLSRKTTPAELALKESAKGIVKSLEAGEEMATTTVHLSEVLNILEDRLGIEDSTAFLAWAIAAPSLTILPVGLEDYESALNTAKEKRVGINDSLAYHFMLRNGFSEIYSMDKHYDRLNGVTRLTKSVGC